MPYRVISPIQHLGKNYAVGDAIELAPHEAYQLVAAKCVEEVPPPVPQAAAAPHVLRAGGPGGYVPPKPPKGISIGED